MLPSATKTPTDKICPCIIANLTWEAYQRSHTPEIHTHQKFSIHYGKYLAQFRVQFHPLFNPLKNPTHKLDNSILFQHTPTKCGGIFNLFNTLINGKFNSFQQTPTKCGGIFTIVSKCAFHFSTIITTSPITTAAPFGPSRPFSLFCCLTVSTALLRPPLPSSSSSPLLNTYNCHSFIHSHSHEHFFYSSLSKLIKLML